MLKGKEIMLWVAFWGARKSTHPLYEIVRNPLQAPQSQCQGEGVLHVAGLFSGDVMEADGREAQS